MSATRVAAVDCGTNSLRLLVADIDGGRLSDVVRKMEIVRLGQGVDRTGRFAPDALQRTFAALRVYADEVRSLGAERVRMVATSATRDASNRDVFLSEVKQVLGVDPEVVTGLAEAELSFLGATRELAESAPYLVVDIGGGSTEFIVGDRHADAAISVDIGCVRLTERHLHSDPPTATEIEATVGDIDSALDHVRRSVPVDRARTLVGLAGSVTTVAGIALDLPAYDASRIHHSVIARADVDRVTSRLLAMTRSERAALPVMHPGRLDVIGAGALVLDRVMKVLDFQQVLVSEHDILDGIAFSLVPS
jgi:exopolyphosphatase/guanosine-5'-triphosphate,3'-diphosphate pyrophosphatase